jgi:glutamyl-tRNA reductase
MTTADPLADPGLIALVAHARTVPSDARDAFGAAALGIADPRVIVLRTCHRVEVYAIEPATDSDPLELPAAPAGATRLEGTDAARHLLRVAAGLESVVVGEDQILHQLRECLADRRVPAATSTASGRGQTGASLHPALARAFQLALGVGRATRSWREGPPRSLADDAIEVIAGQAAPGGIRRVLVVGAGRMARLAAHAAARRDAQILVANRHAGRAAALAAEVDGEVAPFGEAADLPVADAVLVALSGHWPLGVPARGALIAGRQPVVDLSSPPALDEATRDALGARYTSIDDLARDPAEVLGPRLRARMDAAVEDALGALERWSRTRTTVPAIRALTGRAEARRSAELERLFRRTDLRPDDRDLVEPMSRRQVPGLLHAPIVTLRDDETGDLEAAARTLFAL